MQQLIVRGVVSTLLLALLIAVLWSMLPEAPIFADLVGPVMPTALPEPPQPTSPQVYTTAGDRNNNGIAIVLKDTTGSWLGLAHGLKSIGVPFTIVGSIDEALQHDVIMVYPTLTGANTAADDLQQLAQHVRAGGTLVGFAVIGGGMPDVFGFAQSAEVPQHTNVEFQPLALTGDFTREPVAANVSLGSEADGNAGMPGTSYTGLKLPAVALFEDGSGAVTRNVYESAVRAGHAYAFGFDLGHFILRAQNGRFTRATDGYVNGYQPQVDTFLRLLEAIYREGEPDAVVLSPTPHNKEFTALMTHDIDFTRSMTNIPAYAALESEHDIKATYFIQTKYVKDFSDDVFLTPGNVPVLQQLQMLGMEVASHSVAHSNLFSSMNGGDGKEQYPDYRPFVKAYDEVRNASILGELRVSKFLLDTLTPTDVVSFRPGHLSLPASLPQMLVATGFQYSSSITAGMTMSHLPFRLMDERAYASEVAAYEFPVTIEDEKGKLGDRFDAAVDLSNRVAEYQGLVNILIHTDVLDHKLEFERRYLETFGQRAWFSTVRAYGDWWKVRDSATTTVHTNADGVRSLLIEANGTIDGLTLQVPGGWHYQSGLAGTTQQDTRVILGGFTDKAELAFAVDAVGPPTSQ